MPSALLRIIEHPLQFIKFFYCFVAQLFLLALTRLLLPTYPQYQSLRIQVQKAYLSSTALHFPTFTHRLPADYSVNDAAPIKGNDWSGYVIPGPDADVLTFMKTKGSIVVLYAHGGGYARGEARMYVPYHKRWVDCAERMEMRLLFISVEYPLSGEASHPAQRDSFLAAYRHLLELGIPAGRVVFMGDSAGGGISINAGLQALQAGLPQPACSVLISPWLDMALEAYEGGNPAVLSDFFVVANDAVPAMAKAFLGRFSGKEKEANPLLRSAHEVTGLNPQLIMVGAAEFARADSVGGEVSRSGSSARTCR